MLKHIRVALKLAHLRASEVVIAKTPKGHMHIRKGGKLIVASSSPKDGDPASRRIAKELMQWT